MKVLTVVGNRPQFVKAAAVSHRLRELATEVLVHTGQHYDRELSQLFFEELDVPEPEHRLQTGSGTHAAQTAALLTALEPLVHAEAPDAVCVYGDTNSTLAGALVAAKASVPIAHVEAGMRSFDRTMPEEVNRVVTDHLSQLLLCPTPTAVANCGAEGLAALALEVGDVQADVALLLGPAAERRSAILERLGLQAGGYAVATAHRQGNVDDPARLAALVDVLAAAAARGPVVATLHPRTRTRLEAGGRMAALAEAGVTVVEPLGYLDFTALLRGARVMLTDSGGVQKEAYLAEVPCLTMRDTTEWIETVEAGWNRLVDLDLELVGEGLDALGDVGSLPAPDPEIYGGGRAGARTAQAIVERLSRE